MIEAMNDALAPGLACPACGGSGGGPFGRLGSAWDVETYECPRCHGTGVVDVDVAAGAALPRPLAKGSARRPEPPVAERRGPASTRPAAASAPARASKK